MCNINKILHIINNYEDKKSIIQPMVLDIGILKYKIFVNSKH